MSACGTASLQVQQLVEEPSCVLQRLRPNLVAVVGAHTLSTLEAMSSNMCRVAMTDPAVWASLRQTKHASKRLTDEERLHARPATGVPWFIHRYMGL